MYSILIVDDNIKFISFVINNIISKFDSLRIAGISNNVKTTAKLMIDQHIDIIIADSEIICSTLSILPESVKVRYSNSLIITLNPSTSVINLENLFDFAPIVIKDNDFEKNIMNEIKSLIKYQSKNYTKNKIIYELQKIGYNFNLKGSQYLMYVILEILSQKSFLLFNLNKDIYPAVAKKLNMPVHNMRCDITRATENMVYFSDTDKLKLYFGNNSPTTKTVIYIILKKII